MSSRWTLTSIYTNTATRARVGRTLDRQNIKDVQTCSSMESDFDGKVAFIAGAAHGQGRAVALALAGQGARIVGYDIARQIPHPGYALGSAADLESLASEVRTLGTDALVFSG